MKYNLFSSFSLRSKAESSVTILIVNSILNKLLKLEILIQMTIEKLFRITISINIIADKVVRSKVTTIIPTSIEASINS